MRILLRLGSIARIYFNANGGTATQDSTEVSTKYDMGTEYRANGWKYPLYDGTEGHGASAKNLTAVDGKTVILRPYWDLIVNSVEPAITCYTTTNGESGGTQVTAQKTTLHEKELYNGIYSGKYYQYRDKVTTYTFNGWWTAKTGGSQVTSFAAPSGSGDNNNKTVYAHYAETVTYDYSVYPSNGTVIYPPSSGSYGTWNGSTKGPGTLTGATVSGTTTESDAGTYTAYYTPKSGYCWADGTRNQKSVTWSIERASISDPTADSYTYNGKEQGPGNKAYTVSSGDIKATNAGNYKAYYTPDDNHCWSNGTYGSRTLTWSISKVEVDASTLKDATYEYTGSSHELPKAPTGSTRSGTTTITNVGSATATYTLKDKTNYVWSTGGTANKTVTYTVTKASQSFTVKASPKNIAPTETSTITVTGTTYGTISYKSSDTKIAVVAGSEKTGTVQGKTEGDVTITVTAGGDANHNSASNTVTVHVAKKSQSITVDPTSKTINVDESFTISVSGAKGTVSYTTNSSAIASVGSSTGKVTGNKEGSAEITVKAAATDMYNEAKKTVTVTVKEAKIPGTDIPADESNDPEHWFFKAKYVWNIPASDTATGKVVTVYDVLLTNEAMKNANGNWDKTTESYKIWKGQVGNWSAVGDPVAMADYSGNARVRRYFGHCTGIDVGGKNESARNTIHAYKPFNSSNYYYVSVCSTSRPLKSACEY